MIRQFYYEKGDIKWSLLEWKEKCLSCGEVSNMASCPNCGTIKPATEKPVTNRELIKQLNTFNPDVILKIEAKLKENEDKLVNAVFGTGELL